MQSNSDLMSQKERNEIAAALVISRRLLAKLVSRQTEDSSAAGLQMRFRFQFLRLFSRYVL